MLNAGRGRLDASGRRAAVRYALATVAAVVLVAVVSATRLWNAVDPPAIAAVRFEVRLAETVSAPGLREAPVGTEPRLVYLYDDVVVSNDDIVAARVIPDRGPDRDGVEIRLSPKGSATMRAATRVTWAGRWRCSSTVCVAAAPTVRSEIGDVGLLSSSYSRQDAERLVRGILPR